MNNRDAAQYVEVLRLYWLDTQTGLWTARDPKQAISRGIPLTLATPSRLARMPKAK